MKQCNLAGGRRLPDLLFVTSEKALAELEADELIAVKQALPADRLITLSPDSSAEEAASERVWNVLRSKPGIEGVVLIGGYDTVPSRPIKVIDDDLANSIDPESCTLDPDYFVVWNDDVYGDCDGDGMPELPVSRIPGSAIWSGLQVAGLPTETGCRGIRASEFEFADPVFRQLSMAETMHVVPDASGTAVTPTDLTAGRLYLALHGRSETPTKLFGGTGPNGLQVEAFSLDTIPNQLDGGVVFCGACWGALTVTALASIACFSDDWRSRTADDSIAVKFVKSGVRAFVGFTAEISVPHVPPFQYFAGPLHELFWRYCVNRDMPPAKALFHAKADFIANAPRPSRQRRTPERSLAAEMKIFWSATCLGLGW